MVRHGRAIRVRVSTTHPAMIEFFQNLFSSRGHVHQYSKKSDLTGFEWCLDCDLDETFSFLLGAREELRAIIESPELFASFLAGFFDSEGSVSYHKKLAHGGFEFALANMDGDLMIMIARELANEGFEPHLRRDHQQPRRGVKNGGDSILRLSIWAYDQVNRILQALPFKHREKRAKRELALSLAYKATTEERNALVAKWNRLKSTIRCERDQSVREAQLDFERRRDKGEGMNPFCKTSPGLPIRFDRPVIQTPVDNGDVGDMHVPKEVR